MRIEIRDGVHAPLVITDPAIVDRFSIWNGPGVGAPVNGVELRPAYLDSQVDDGRFIDWPAGAAGQRAASLPRFEVSFYIDGPRSEISEYLVAYETDLSSHEGYIYLPRWTNSLISHDVEGNWFHASARWDELVMPLVVERMSGAARSDAGKFRCGGTARIEGDGTIDMQFVRDGSRIAHMRFPPSSDLYAEAAALVGTSERGTEMEISCWPPRH